MSIESAAELLSVLAAWKAAGIPFHRRSHPAVEPGTDAYCLLLRLLAQQEQTKQDEGVAVPPRPPKGTHAEDTPGDARFDTLSPMQYDILDALRGLNAIDPEKRVTGPEVAGKVGGDATEQSVKAPLAGLVKRGLIGSRTGRKGGSWLTSEGLQLINSLRSKQ